VTGETLGENFLLDLGTDVVKTERGFNNRVGFTRADDRLPAFFSQEKLPPSGLVFDVPEAELDSIYES
jgi:aldehyde:ferredoxin oxidoreductase